MKFRPCIDIHNGKVKQLVGGTLTDKGNKALENFVSTKSAAQYAKMYKEDGLTGGHIILLNKEGTEYFEATKAEALSALMAYPNGMQIGGGINADNAKFYIDNGATHVIVTSYVFSDGKISYERLEKLRDAVGKEHIVLDLSCRKKDDKYLIVTDRWQKYTNEEVTKETLEKLYQYCDEFLVHGVDVEGKSAGMEEELVKILADWDKCQITYAGGLGSIENLNKFREVSKNKLDFTIGSALDVFGGKLPYDEIKKIKY